MHRQQNQSDQHHETAEGRDEKRLQRRSPALLAVDVVPDEQVAQHARDLPEHEHHDDVVRRHEPIHRAGEGKQQRREPAEAGLIPGEVPRTVHKDEAADAGDDEREEPRESVDTERE